MATLGYQITEEEELDDPKHVKMVFDNEFYALYFSRARIPFGRDVSDYPVYKHLGVYAYTRRFVETFAKLPLADWKIWKNWSNCEPWNMVTRSRSPSAHLTRQR